ncbi:MAG: Gfo/Idh/MocA family oxidoreductase [Treponema sp.]|jgi:predicted dehydrogenase|nr:Gfo/Idh/MocA family oxidoreductase [Treponema sp.]
MEKINATLIGLGRIGSLLEDDALREKPCTHAGAIAASLDCVLAAGCDTDEERRRLFGEKWRVPVYADAAEMIAACRPRLVAVATHPDSHERYCRLAAACGVPVVICEKPLAAALGPARRIAALEKSGQVRIIANHERRYSADYIKARAILDEGRLGRILSVNAAICMGRNRRLLDVLWHDGTHLADAIMFLSGLAMRHKKHWGAKLGARTGTAWLSGLLIPAAFPAPAGATALSAVGLAPRWSPGHSAPIPFVIQIGAERDHLIFEMEFSCECGRLRIGNGIFEVWESVESPYAESFRSLKKTTAAFEGPTGYFANMAADAAACVRDPVRRARSTAADGLRVIEYLHAVSPWVR